MSYGEDQIPSTRFELEGSRYVALSFGSAGPGQSLASTMDEWRNGQQIRLMEEIGDLVYREPRSLRDATHFDAFSHSPSIVLSAFMESGFEDELAKRVIDSVMGSCDEVEELQTARPYELARVISVLGEESVARHPEATDLLTKVGNYYVEIYQDLCIGSAALAGMGFMLSQLDYAWDRVREEALDRVVADETQSLDWESLLPPEETA